MDRPNNRPRLTSVVPPQLENYEDFDIHTAQLQNDRRLKSKFEEIFYKYGRDFGEVGDEIDLETGEIIVDNGHLSGMRDEQDVGDVVNDTQVKGRSLLRALTVEPEFRSAQINGRSLIRALTGAPEDLGTPPHNCVLDDEDVFSEGEGQFFAGNEWDDFGDEEEYNLEDGKDSFRRFDADREPDSSDSDDSILGPKKERHRSRNFYPISSPPSQALADNHQSQNLRPRIFHSLREQPSLQVATDPTWRAPLLEGDSLHRAARHDSIELSKSVGYTSPNNKSLWAPIQTRKPRKSKSNISPSAGAKHAQGRRQAMSGGQSVTTLAKMHATSEDSDDPLQSNVVTTPASTLISSAARTVEKRVLSERRTPKKALVSSGEVCELGNVEDPSVFDGVQSGPSAAEARASTRQDAFDGKPKNKKSAGVREGHVPERSPRLISPRPMTEHERRSKAAKDSAARRWETRRRNQELNRAKFDQLPQTLSKQPDVNHQFTPQQRDRVFQKALSEGGVVHVERVVNDAGNASERPTRSEIHFARNGTYQSPSPPIEGDTSVSGTFREVRIGAEQEFSAEKMLRGFFEVTAVDITGSTALSHAAASTLERLWDAERYPGRNVIDFDESFSASKPLQPELGPDKDMEASGDAADTPSGNPESPPHGVNRRLNRKRDKKQSSADKISRNDTPLKRKRRSNIQPPLVIKERDALFLHPKEDYGVQRLASNSSPPRTSDMEVHEQYPKNSRPESAERQVRRSHERGIDMRPRSSANSTTDPSFMDDPKEENYFEDGTQPYAEPNLRRPVSVTSFLGNGIRETTFMDTDGERPTTPLLRSVIEPFLSYLGPRGANKQGAAETSRANRSDDSGGDSDYQPEFSGSSAIPEIAHEGLTSAHRKSLGSSSKSRRTPRRVTSYNPNSRPKGRSRYIRARDRNNGWQTLVGASSEVSCDSSTS